MSDTAGVIHAEIRRGGCGEERDLGMLRRLVGQKGYVARGGAQGDDHLEKVGVFV
jgi:hypothetical protein